MDEGPAAKDEGPAAKDEGPEAKDEGPAAKDPLGPAEKAGASLLAAPEGWKLNPEEEWATGW